MAKKEKMLATKSGRKNVINCIIALIIAVVFLFPIYWILAMSFKTDAESFGNYDRSLGEELKRQGVP